MLVIALPSRFPLRVLIALALGVLHAMAFIDDATWPIEVAALAGLVALASRAANETHGWRAALGGARVGLAFGLGWFLTGISWIYISMHTYGEMNPVLAGLATFLFAGYLALYPTLACAGYAAFRFTRAQAPRKSELASVAVFAGLWGLSEVARGTVFTGFPWLASGYAHVAGPLAGYAPLIGVYGVSMLAAAIAATLALSGARTTPRTTAPARGRWLPMLIVVFGIPIAGSALSRIDWTLASGSPIAVRLLQGNVPQDVKFIEARFDGIVDQYLKAIDAPGTIDLVVLPETAFPRFLSDLPESLGERLATAVRTRNAAIAFGVPIIEGEDRYFNSVVAIAPAPGSATAAPDVFAGLRAQRYDKSHLVPFGEFVPFGFRWFVRLMKMPLGDFTRGSIDQRPMELAGQRIAFNICYEDLFGEEINRQASDASILVNVSNVAWFGDSMALPQHLNLNRMRSVETGRPMLRATNTGMTASIDPHGRVLAQLAPFTEGALDVRVQGTTGRTPFVRWGNLPAIAAMGLLLAWAWWSTRTGRRVRLR